jgi:hypothetical protein
MRIAIACLLAGLAVGSAGAEQKRIILPPDHEYARLKAGPGSDVT